MLHIQSRGLPTLGAHWSMGPDHMRQVSRGDAARILQGFQLPRIGYETVAQDNPGPWGFRQVLSVQNICGVFFVASHSNAISEWPAVFGVTVLEN